MSDSQLFKELTLLREYTKALNAQNNTKDIERRQLETQLENLKKEIINSSTTRRADQQILEFQLSIRNLQQKINKLEKEKNTLSKNYDTLVNQRQSKPHSSIAVSSSLVRYQEHQSQQKYQSLQRQIKTMNISYQAIKEQKFMLEQSNRELEKQLSKVSLQLYNIRQEIIIKDHQIRQLRKQNLSAKGMIQYFSKKKEQEKIQNFQGQQKKHKQNYQLLAQELFQIKESREKKYNQQRNNYQVRIHQFQRKQAILYNQILILKSQLELKQNQIKRIKQGADSQSYQDNFNANHQSLNVKLNNQRHHSKSSTYTFRNQLTQSIGSQTLQKQLTSVASELTIRIEEIRSLKKEIQSNAIRISEQYSQLLAKDQDNKRLKQLVFRYQERIHQLSIKLQQINQDSNQNFRIKTQLNKLILSNQSLSQQIAKLFNQNKRYIQRLKDYERRILILEEANNGLQNQLRKTIQSRNNSEEDNREERLVLIINDLQKELKENKELIQRVRNQRQYINQKRSNKQDYSKFPQRQKIILRDYENLNRITNNKNLQIMFNETKKEDFKRSRNRNKSMNFEKWQIIQRKINILESENSNLKQNLITLKKT